LEIAGRWVRAEVWIVNTYTTFGGEIVVGGIFGLAESIFLLLPFMDKGA
jgi:hypothetical protein